MPTPLAHRVRDVGAAAAWRPGKAGIWVAVGPGALITAVGIRDAQDISETDLEVGGKLHLTILGGVVMFAAALTAWSKQRTTSPALVEIVDGKAQRVDDGVSTPLVRPWITIAGLFVPALLAVSAIFGD